MKLHGKASHFDEKRGRLQVDDALERYPDLSGKDIIVINDDGKMRQPQHALGTTLKARQPRVRKCSLSLARALFFPRAPSLSLSLFRTCSRSRSQARQPGVRQVRDRFSWRAEHVVCRRRSAPLRGRLRKRSPK